MSESYFKGYHAIGEVAARITHLAIFQQAYMPAIRTLRIKRVDFDLVERWPKAAALHGFDKLGNQITFKGFTLIHDKGAARYAPR